MTTSKRQRRQADRLIPGLLIFTVLAGTALAAPPGVRHVRADAAPGGDGLTWETAYNDLRAALITACSSAGSITEIWVAEGVYTPTLAGAPNVASNFTLVPDVGVYGGFAGTETSRDQRDPITRVTMLSGQIGTSNVYNVVVGAGNSGTVLDGFTITGGRAWLPLTAGTGWAGGGIYFTGSPVIRNCIIASNSTNGSVSGAGRHRGGGVYCAPGSSPTLIDCLITGNTTSTSYFTPGYNGGGLAAEDAAVHLIRCTFRNNQSGSSGYGICGGGFPSSTGQSGNGGGIYALNSSLLLEGCTLDSNSTANGGAGAVCGQGPWPGLDAGNGAGIYSETSTLFAVNCTFTRNRTGTGGAGAGSFGFGTHGGNGGIGGGLYTAGGDVDLVNCTIADNIVGAGGHGGSGSPPGAPGSPGYATSIRGDSSARLENCISWNDGLNEIVGASAVYCDVRGGPFGPGGIAADPLFIGAAGGDYRIGDSSPCIDAGNSFPATGALPPIDAAGLARRVDIASVIDTGVGPPVVDMGAYEVQACAIDYTGDGLVDFSDYLEFLNLFDAQDLRADLNHDGLVDFSDYLEFLNFFDGGC